MMVIDRRMMLRGSLVSLGSLGLVVAGEGLSGFLAPASAATSGRTWAPVSYFYPTNAGWDVIEANADLLGPVVLDKDSGDWAAYSAEFASRFSSTSSAGIGGRLAYVKTQYAVASLPPDDPARDGVPNPDRYTKDYVLTQLAHAVSWYGPGVTGVFLDEVVNGFTASQAARCPWYADLIATIRSTYGSGFTVVLNPGCPVAACVADLDADIEMVFEGAADDYLAMDTSTLVNAAMAAHPAAKWWQVVQSVTTSNVDDVARRLAGLPVAHAYLTDGVLYEGSGGQWQPEGDPYASICSSFCLEATRRWIEGGYDAASPASSPVMTMTSAWGTLRLYQNTAGASFKVGDRVAYHATVESAVTPRCDWVYQASNMVDGQTPGGLHLWWAETGVEHPLGGGGLVHVVTAADARRGWFQPALTVRAQQQFTGTRIGSATANSGWCGADGKVTVSA